MTPQFVEQLFFAMAEEDGIDSESAHSIWSNKPSKFSELIKDENIVSLAKRFKNTNQKWLLRVGSKQ